MWRKIWTLWRSTTCSSPQEWASLVCWTVTSSCSRIFIGTSQRKVCLQLFLSRLRMIASHPWRVECALHATSWPCAASQTLIVRVTTLHTACWWLMWTSMDSCQSGSWILGLNLRLASGLWTVRRLVILSKRASLVSSPKTSLIGGMELHLND